MCVCVCVCVVKTLLTFKYKTKMKSINVLLPSYCQAMSCETCAPQYLWL